MSSEKSFFDKCVRGMSENSSETIMNKGIYAGYDEVSEATRYFVDNPVYSATWLIAGAEKKMRDYSPIHSHDFPELNILVGAPGDLVYRILIGEEEREVESPSTILIPAGVRHSANLVRGVGAFVVARLDPVQLDL